MYCANIWLGWRICLFGVRPFPEPMPTYCRLVLRVKTSTESKSKFYILTIMSVFENTICNMSARSSSELHVMMDVLTEFTIFGENKNTVVYIAIGDEKENYRRRGTPRHYIMIFICRRNFCNSVQFNCCRRCSICFIWRSAHKMMLQIAGPNNKQ